MIYLGLHNYRQVTTRNILKLYCLDICITVYLNCTFSLDLAVLQTLSLLGLIGTHWGHIGTHRDSSGLIGALLGLIGALLGLIGTHRSFIGTHRDSSGLIIQNSYTQNKLCFDPKHIYISYI